MATLTSNMATSGVSARSVHAAENSVSVRYNSESTVVSASSATVLMVKIPNHCTITSISGDHSIGAATCPTDYGIGTETLSYFASAVTIGALTVSTGVLPYTVSISDNAVDQFTFVKVTPTPGTATTSFKANLTVKYLMN